jgi:hypothetical protein
VSPLLTLIVGLGHCPLMPTKGLANPSGAARTQPTLQVNDLLAGFGVATGARAEGLEHTAPVALVTELDVVEVVAGADDDVDAVVAAADEVTDELEESLDEAEEDVLPGALDVEVTEVGVETVELVEGAELDVEDVVTTELLELETITGLRLLYIDNLLAPPHYPISQEKYEHIR